MTPPAPTSSCFLDITASHENRGILLDVVRRTAEACFMPLTVGGGVRTIDDIRRLLLAGADKVSINTAAVSEPRLRARGGGEIRRPVHRRGDRRQEACPAERPAAGRSSPMAAATPTGIDASTTRARWPRSAPARSCSPRWIATAPARASTSRSPARVADAVAVPVIASGGVGTLAASGRRHSRRPRDRGARRLDLSFRRALRSGEAKAYMAARCRCGSTR